MMRQPRVELHLLKVGSCRHLERMALRGARWRMTEFPALAALIIHPLEGPILFDTGYARHFEDATASFPERLYRWMTPVDLPPGQTLERQLARFGIGLRDIGRCVVSHFHGDHIAGLRDLPRARIIASQAARADLARRGRWDRLVHGLLPALLPSDLEQRFCAAESSASVATDHAWQELGPAHDLLGDRSLLGVALPGHAAGQLGLLIRDLDDRQVLLAADACWSIRSVHERRLPSRLTALVMHDWGRYAATLAELSRISAAQPESVILPSHCAASLAAYEPGWSTQ
jgi:glyoxylase-like metal-dependent hydrolase (beta-lactamase superfamily II)